LDDENRFHGHGPSVVTSKAANKDAEFLSASEILFVMDITGNVDTARDKIRGI